MSRGEISTISPLTTGWVKFSALMRARRHNQEQP